jgi:hypothetical protein
MPESKPKGSYHVDKEFVDASHPDQIRFQSPGATSKFAIRIVAGAKAQQNHDGLPRTFNSPQSLNKYGFYRLQICCCFQKHSL